MLSHFQSSYLGVPKLIGKQRRIWSWIRAVAPITRSSIRDGMGVFTLFTFATASTLKPSPPRMQKRFCNGRRALGAHSRPRLVVGQQDRVLAGASVAERSLHVHAGPGDMDRELCMRGSRRSINRRAALETGSHRPGRPLTRGTCRHTTPGPITDLIHCRLLGILIVDAAYLSQNPQDHASRRWPLELVIQRLTLSVSRLSHE